MRHQHLLIRRLAVVLRTRMTKAGHLAQVIYHEHRGNCLPPRNGCSPACSEARALVALTEPYMPAASKPRPVVVIGCVPRLIRRRTSGGSVPVQQDLFGDEQAPALGAVGRAS